MAEQSVLETRAEAEAASGVASYWQTQLDLSDKDHQDFIKNGQAVVERYRGEKQIALKKSNRRFNILYSNTETLKAAVFARMAKPDVRRRFSDQDPVGRQVAEVVERSLIYCDDAYDAEREFETAIEDYLLPGRGIVKVEYEAETVAGEDGAEQISSQELRIRHWHWEDFRHEPARRWCKVTWCAFRHLMNRDALVENFGELGGDAPLNWSPDPANPKMPDAFKRGEVWEIWDKEKRQRVWVIKGYSKVLRTDDDPYELEGFFPVAEPLQAITTTSTLIPEPEFHSYRDQADGLDEIEDRIARLTKALKRRGVYDATFAELKRLANAADNEFIPVKNYAELSSKGGLAAAFQAEDLNVMAQVLAELHSQRDLRVQTIYEVVGIADIMRGATDPRETLGAQRIKAQFGGNRLRKRQDKVQKWIRDTLRLEAEIVAEHFQPQKLAEITGLPLDPLRAPDPQTAMIATQSMQLLRSDRLRGYRVDVETDSTIFEDAAQQKQDTTELLTAIVQFLGTALPAGQTAPELMPLLFEMLSFGLRSFKAGRSLEDTLEQTKMRLQQRLANPQPAPPDPKMQAEQAKAAAHAQKAQIDAQSAAQKAQLEMQTTMAKSQAEIAKLQAQIEFMVQKMDIDRRQMMMHAEQKAIDLGMKQREAELKSNGQEQTPA